MRAIDAPLPVVEPVRFGEVAGALEVSDGVRERMRASRVVLGRALAAGEPVYGRLPYSVPE